MRLGRTHVGLHAAGHRLASQHEIRDLLVHEIDKSGINLLRVGHRESLDIHLVLNARYDHFVLRGVGDFVRQPFAVGVALRDGLAVDDGLPVSMAEVHVVGDREFLCQNERCRSREESQIPGIDENVVPRVGRMPQIPVWFPDPLAFENDTLVGQHIAALDTVHLGYLTRFRVYVRHDFQ